MHANITHRHAASVKSRSKIQFKRYFCPRPIAFLTAPSSIFRVFFLCDQVEFLNSMFDNFDLIVRNIKQFKTVSIEMAFGQMSSSRLLTEKKNSQIWSIILEVFLNNGNANIMEWLKCYHGRPFGMHNQWHSVCTECGLHAHIKKKRKRESDSFSQ